MPRVKALAKLFLLLGLPLGLLAGLFGAGVYLGHAHRATILRFEKTWLGMDVEVPSAAWIGPWAARARDPKAPAAPSPAPAAAPAPAPTEPPVAAPPAAPPTTPPDATPPAPAPDAAAPLLAPPVRPAMPLTVVLPEPVDAELQAALRAPRTLRIKALVDPAVAPDDFAYVQRIIEWSGQILGSQLGVDLELIGVVRWDGARRTLCERPREGADVLLGFSRQVVDDEDPLLGSGCALVGVNPRSHQAPHLRPALFSLGRLLGAAAIGDPGSDAWRRGSWMADALADDAQPLWIDPESRRAMILSKAAPAPEVDPEAAPEAAAPEEE